MKNINQRVRTPDILNSADIRRIAHSNSAHSSLKAYDASVLSRDIQVEIERAHRYGSPFSILLIDVILEDDSVRDSIINSLTTDFSYHIRLTDTVYLYNRSRFVLLLGETNTNAAIQTSINIQNVFSLPQKISKSPFYLNIGIASYGLFHIDTDHKLLTAADKALDEAGNTGKGLIYLYHGKDILEVNDEGIPVVITDKIQKRMEITGVPIHPGTALGTIFVYNDLLSHEMESYDIREENLEDEYTRIEQAIHEVEKDLLEMEEEVNHELSREHSVIFQAHRLILNDRQILDEIKTQLFERRVNAEEVIRDVFKRWEMRFLAFDDEVFRNKSQDIADISRRVLTELQGIESHILESVPENSVIFSIRLLPSDTVHINKKNVKAIVTKEGSRFSHTAIIAKAMNIPMIILENMDLTLISNGTTVFIDGSTGAAIIYPNLQEIGGLKSQILSYTTEYSRLQAVHKDHKDLIYKGEEVKLYTVVASLDESVEGISFAADGIGLFRMEVLYLTRDSMPGEDFLFEKLDKILEPFKDKEIIIRLLDIGGDKTLSYLDISERYNSSLGVRGIRLLIKYPQLLESQLRVCLKLSLKFKIKILIPMVTVVEDVIHVKEMLHRMMKSLNIKKSIPLGTMIETPAAVLAARAIIEQSDFVSIGTNDLIQYTMAADREKMNVSQYFEQGNVAIQEYIRIICSLAGEAGKPCYLCGELAQNTSYTKDLLELGCRNFSVTSTVIPVVRQAILDHC
nr:MULTISPECIES: phosphoenolpyruvate--protein phosphotransferase [unclassified Oceanispirochaeta]